MNMRVILAFFAGWVLMGLLTLLTKSVMFEVLMPLIIIGFVIYMIVATVLAVKDESKKEEKKE